jgi:uncharacterized membrane-anchored protein YjiN (DUF445 family)
MVFSLTIDFLQQRFPKKLELERFSQTDTKELYSALLKKVSKDEVIENRQEIRRAIVEYAKDTAKSVVLFRALDQITIKFAPLDKLDSASDEYKKLLNIIKEKKKTSNKSMAERICSVLMSRLLGHFLRRYQLLIL